MKDLGEMQNDDLKKMLLFCNDKGYLVEGKMISVSRLVFEECVKMNCFYCGKYNISWKCPPTAEY